MNLQAISSVLSLIVLMTVTPVSQARATMIAEGFTYGACLKTSAEAGLEKLITQFPDRKYRFTQRYGYERFQAALTADNLSLTTYFPEKPDVETITWSSRSTTISVTAEHRDDKCTVLEIVINDQP